MRRLLTAARLGAIAALIIFAGSSCTTPHSSFATRDLGGGAWPGWKDIDEGGFEEDGWVLFPEAGTATFYGAKVAAPVTPGAFYVVNEPVDYEFYIKREGLARLLPFTTYIRLRVTDEIPANRIVLDQAASSGGVVHISGRQHSGLHPGAGYVQLMRVTPIKPAKRIAW